VKFVRSVPGCHGITHTIDSLFLPDVVTPDFSKTPVSKEIRFHYNHLHLLIRGIRYTALTMLWGVFCVLIVIFFVAYLSETACIASFSIFASVFLLPTALLSHSLREYDHKITKLHDSSNVWFCYCPCCCLRRKNDRISHLIPSGLHRVLAHAHTWTVIPATGSLFFLLGSLQTTWLFVFFAVLLFAVVDVVLCFEIRAYVWGNRRVVSWRRFFRKHEHAKTPINPPHFLRPSKKTDIYSNRLGIPEAGNGSPTAQGDCARPKATAHTGYGIVPDEKRDESEEPDETFDENIHLALNRSITPDGKQRFDGWVRFEFQEGQKQLTQHIPFLPAFRKIPRVILESTTDLELRIDEPVVFLHGCRFDVKRLKAFDLRDTSTVVQFAVIED